MRSQNPLARAAFTLTELLVVIAILAILASLAAVGVMKALDTAKQTRIKVEVDNLDASFKSYKEKYGSYPPCDLTTDSAATAALTAHIARAFPRYDINQLPFDMDKTGVDRSNCRPDQALVFWLQGFNPDVSHPFVFYDPVKKLTFPISNGMVGTIPVTVTPLFDFDKSRLVLLNNSTALSYAPLGVKNLAPYIYYDNAFYGRGNTPYQALNAIRFASPAYLTSDAGWVAPYVKDSGPNTNMFDLPAPGVPGDEWVNPDSFQIICCGLDGKFGAPSTTPDPVQQTLRLYPSGVLYTLGQTQVSGTYFGYDREGADDDNITNFCERSRIGDAKP